MIKKLFVKNKIDLLFIGLIILLGIPLILPYFHSGYFPTHDGEWAVVRLAEMFREVKDYQFPPRYSTVLNNGYGYPLFNFAYPFPYYVALVFKMAGFGFIESIKIVFALTVPFSGIGMYLLSKSLWKNRAAGIMAALFYMYWPYRMIDLYVRGSIGESLALAIVPFLFYLAFKLVDSKKPMVLISISAILLASLILTHNIMAVYFVPLFILFCIVLSSLKRKFSFNYLYVLVLGIGISTFFWFPALFEKNNILLSVIPIADRNLYWVKPLQLIIPSWGYGVPTDSTDSFSYQLGIGVITSIFVTSAILIWDLIKKIKIDLSTKIAGTFLGLLFVMIVMMFPLTKFIWEHLPILSEINYPWTLLAPIGFIGTLLVGFVVRTKTVLYVFVGLFILNAFFVIQYANPEKYVSYEDGYYSTNVANTTSSSEYTPVWVKTMPKQNPQSSVEVVKGKGSVTNIILKSNSISFDSNMETNGTVRINTIYYPGWEILVNGKLTNFSYNNKFGVMELPLKSGTHTVVVKFVETKSRLASDFVSLLSAITVGIIFVIGLFQLKKHVKEKK